jgi:CBS domain-containing protein
MKELAELTVADYMTERPTVAEDTDRLIRAIGVMEDQRLSALPVVNENGLVVGILSVSDLVTLSHEVHSDLGALSLVNESTQQFLIRQLRDQGETTLVRDVMSSPVETARRSENLVQAARKLVDRQYHHLPVVDDEGLPVGILATSDFVRAFADYGAFYPLVSTGCSCRERGGTANGAGASKCRRARSTES